jgi:secondary thiamine-phosphate synthase enzyme
MTSATEYLWFETKTERAFLRITEKVRDVVRRSGVTEGLVLVSAMHITATVYVNDDEPGLISDISAWADRLAPPGDYAHHRTGESNGDAHLKNLLIGHQVIVPVTNGDLDLGPWEQVFYGEFDGRRRKRVVVKVLGE